MAKKKSTSKKRRTPAQRRADKALGVRSRKASKLLKSGKAKTKKQAFRMAK